MVNSTLSNHPLGQNMLKTRVLTALILIPIVVLITLFSPLILFAILSGIVFLLALKEWANLIGITKTYSGKKLFITYASSLAFSILFFFLLAMLTLLVIFFFLFILHFFFKFDLARPKTYFFWPAYILGLWCLPVIAIFIYPKGTKFYTQGKTGLAIGFMVILLAWFSLVLLQSFNPYLALYALVLVWVADTAAYFVGKKWGQFKLAPNISPGKTWEGLLASVLAGMILSLLAYHLFRFSFDIFAWLIFNMIVVLFAAAGDLFESIFKRANNVKDSGNMLPGHGGILDRVDALLSAIPVFTMGFLPFVRFLI